MSSPSFTQIVCTSPTGPGHRARGGSLSLLSPTGNRHPGFPEVTERAGDAHDFQPPKPSSSRSPCPALNTLSNHGYLPRDGHNISRADLLAALQHHDTYNLSKPLAEFLVVGGLALMREAGRISLHELAEHGRIEHNASITHKNTAKGDKEAPTRCDTVLMEGLLEDKEFLVLDDIARRRVLLEKASPLDPIHAEIARGEWALVLDVFGKAHGGKISTAFLREWLKENRFPEGWKPTHEQGFFATVGEARAIQKKMKAFRSADELGQDEAVECVIKMELTPTLEEAEKAREEH